VVVVVHPSNCRGFGFGRAAFRGREQRVEKDPGFVDQISGHQLRDQYAAAKHGDLSTPTRLQLADGSAPRPSSRSVSDQVN
jgi:hypothetical protein